MFKTAGVADNRFAAEVPAGATADNRLLIVWPAAPNAGGQLAGASAELAGSIDQVAGAPFDGGLLPMYADVSIPADRDQVDALYTVLGSVLRIEMCIRDRCRCVPTCSTWHAGKRVWRGWM